MTELTLGPFDRREIEVWFGELKGFDYSWNHQSADYHVKLRRLRQGSSRCQGSLSRENDSWQVSTQYG